jgi:D-serine deaminase-like pyridoxal phosphate-dependent protein
LAPIADLKSLLLLCMTVNEAGRPLQETGDLARSIYAVTRQRYHQSVMAANFLLQEFPWHDRYRVPDLDNVVTPALALYPDAIASNIQCTLNLLGGNADRWRAHVKTAKLNYTLHLLLEKGVHNFKCATTLELVQACKSGATDVLVAYPVMAANARRLREIANQYPNTRISVLAENKDQIHQWRDSDVGIFLDINPGMNRTGIEQSSKSLVIQLAQAAKESGLEFRGLHYYDGQFGSVTEPELTKATHAGYDQLMELVRDLDRSGIPVSEIITAGTPTFPSSLTYGGFQSSEFLHRVSPGTVVYHDATSLAQLPAEYGYKPAAMVVARVVSHPHRGIVTCDAGHKAVSADAGVPTCVVVGHPELTPLSPSEEHLPLAVKEGFEPPRVGDALYLIPRHVCPTVNNFDAALIVRNGKIEAVENVSARGHEDPLLTKRNISAKLPEHSFTRA